MWMRLIRKNLQEICMKKLFMTLALFGLFLIPAQSANAWSISQLNPLPYIGIGHNSSSFSLNPFTGFKNCNPCKVKKAECDPCKAKVLVKPCERCVKAFPDRPCPCQTRIMYNYQNFMIDHEVRPELIEDWRYIKRASEFAEALF